MDSAFIQARVVSDKVKSNLVGWWQEKHIFYVPLRVIVDTLFSDAAQLVTDDQFNAFFLTNTDFTGAGFPAGMKWTSNNVPYYRFNGNAV